MLHLESTQFSAQINHDSHYIKKDIQGLFGVEKHFDMPKG